MDFKDRPIIMTDLETSGLDPRIHDILEIGAIKVDQQLNVLGLFEAKVHMQHPDTAQEEALGVNGYTVEAWKDAEFLGPAMYDFAQFSRDGILAAWNITFEYGFLSESFRRADIKDLMGYHRIDVPSIAWFEMPNLKKMSMDAVAEALGLGPEPKPHRAMTGARRALDILRWLAAREGRKAQTHA